MNPPQNWFQNRRAKAKQQKKQEEYELQQNLESAGRHQFGQPSQSDFLHLAEFYAPDMEQHLQNPLADSVTIDNPNMMDQSFPPPAYDPQAASYASLDASLALANDPLSHGGFDGLPLSVHGTPSREINGFFPYGVDAQPVDTSNFSASHFSDWGSSRQSSVAWNTPAQQISNPFDAPQLYRDLTNEAAGINLPQSDMHPSMQSGNHEIFPASSGNVEASDFRNPFVARFPSELVHDQQPHMQPSHDQQQQQQYQHHHQQQQQQQQLDQFQSPHELEQRPFDTNTTSTSRSDSSTDLTNAMSNVDVQTEVKAEPVFKQPAPPAVNIAARRKRPRPAAIQGAALRSQSYMGPMPISPNAKSALLGPTSPMRRIKSAGNNLRGRIQKSVSGSAQRSPLNFETFAEAGAFDEYRKTPSISGSQTASAQPMTGNLAPPTPLSPPEMEHLQSEGQSSSSDVEQAFTYQPDYPGYFIPTTGEMQGNVGTPPMTPALHHGLQTGGYHNFMLIQHSPSISGSTQWGLNSADEPIISPQFGTFQSNVCMPQQPLHASPVTISEPDIANQLQYVHFMPEDNQNNNTTGPSSFENSTSSMVSSSNASSTITSTGMSNNNNPPPAPKIVPEYFFHEPLPEHQAPLPQTQHLTQPKPRNYIFANQGPEDF